MIKARGCFLRSIKSMITNDGSWSFITLPARVTGLLFSPKVLYGEYVIYFGAYIEDVSKHEIFDRISCIIDLLPEILENDIRFRGQIPRRIVATLSPTLIEMFPRTLEFNVTRMLESSPEMFAGEIVFAVARYYFLSQHYSSDEATAMAGKVEKKFLAELVGEEYKEPVYQEFRLSRPVLRFQRARFMREQIKRIKEKGE